MLFFQIIVPLRNTAADFSSQAVSDHFGGFKSDSAKASVKHFWSELLLHNFEHDGDLLVSKLNLRPELLDSLTLIESRLISRYHVSEALDLLLIFRGFDTFS